MRKLVMCAVVLAAIGCGKKDEAKVDPGVLADACDNIEKAQQCSEWYGRPKGYAANHCGQDKGGIPGGKVIASCPKEKLVATCVMSEDPAHPRRDYFYEGGFSMDTIKELCSLPSMKLETP